MAATSSSRGAVPSASSAMFVSRRSPHSHLFKTSYDRSKLPHISDRAGSLAHSDLRAALYELAPYKRPSIPLTKLTRPPPSRCLRQLDPDSPLTSHSIPLVTRVARALSRRGVVRLAMNLVTSRHPQHYFGTPPSPSWFSFLASEVLDRIESSPAIHLPRGTS